LSHDLVARTAAALPAMLDDIERLIRCESPSADLEAVARSAHLIARIGEERLGAAPEHIEIDGRSHLRWRLGSADPDAPRVLVLAHHDTVWPVGSLATHPFSIEGGVLRGPGCFDMLTGLVMALHALGGMRLAADAPGAVTLLVTGDEEIGSPSSRALIEEEARGCRAALVLEAAGDGGALKIGRKGVSLYRVAHQVLAVAGFGDAAMQTSVTPTIAASGTTTNTVAAYAEFSVDARAFTVDEQERVDRAMRALTSVTGATLTVHGGINRPPLEPRAAEPLLARASAVAARLNLPEPVGTVVGGASDGNFTAGVGVPTLDGLGAVGGGAHADHEHTLVDEIAPRTTLLAELIRDILRR
jgi:glutamate carboxypeptidase